MATRDIPALMEQAAERGFSQNFELRESRLLCRETGQLYDDAELTKVDMVQTDAGTDPGDEATLFLLEAGDGTRGVLLIGNPAHLSPTERTVLDRLYADQ